MRRFSRPESVVDMTQGPETIVFSSCGSREVSPMTHEMTAPTARVYAPQPYSAHLP